MPAHPRLLVVEDSDSDAFFLQSHIKKCGFESDWEKTAEAGFALLREKRHPVAFLDIDLPHEDGISMAIKVRKEIPEVFVVIFSGSDVTGASNYPPGPGIFWIRKNGLDISEHAVKDILSRLKL